MKDTPEKARREEAMHLATLQDLTARLARIISSTEVASFVLNEGIARLGGTSGSLCLVSGDALEITASAGYPPEVVDTFKRFPIDGTTPAGACAVTRQAVYCETIEELYARWPVFLDGPIVGDPSCAVLPLEASDTTLLGTMVIGFAAPQKFAAIERQLLEAIAREASVALERARANEALVEARRSAEEARDQLAFLAEASQSLAMSLDLNETLEKVASLAVPRLTDRCALYLLDEGGIEKFALAPLLDEHERALFEWGQPRLDDASGVGAVIRTGLAVFLPEIAETFLDEAATSEEHRDLLRRAGIGETFIVPLTVRGENLGALAFVNRPGRPFREQERALGEELAARAAGAIDNARLFSRELNIAETLQHALLPGVPVMESIEASARYLPGVEGVDVGGDWYDIFCPSDEHCSFVVGDVSGRGLRAATTMAALRYATRAYIAQGDPPESVLSKLGGLLSFEAEHKFATVLVGAIEVATREVRIASAGHLPPLLVSPPGAEFVSVPVAAPVGVDTSAAPGSSTVAMPPGSTLIAFTDGLVEQRGRLLDDGLEMLRAAAADADGGLSVSELVDHLVGNLIPGGAPDDVVILGFRWRS